MLVFTSFCDIHFYFRLSKPNKAKEFYLQSLNEYKNYNIPDPFTAVFYELIEKLIGLSNKKDIVVFKFIENNFPTFHRITPNPSLLMKLFQIHQKNIFNFSDDFFIKVDS